nr:MAG TPA: hypothetical protein [Caudoviricetes sp.]DAT15188.1 MAG TPA: hypothetical protein [Caudoviricetes sp.]
MKFYPVCLSIPLNTCSLTRIQPVSEYRRVCWV